MSNRINPNVVFLLSDGTGETAETILSAALTQFREDPVKIQRIGHVLTEKQVHDQLDKAEQKRALIFFTFVDRNLSRFTEKECNKRGIETLDLISPLLEKLTVLFGHSPNGTPGLLHGIDDEYFQRIEAMEFAIKNDDGKSHSRLREADIVLVGVSRSSKTPLSIYLSCQGWKVANIPLVKGIPVQPELFELDPRRVVCLFLDVNRLLERREARLQNMRAESLSSYVNHEDVKQELRWARSLCRDNGWIVVNVNGKSVEETAHEVLVKLGKK